MALPSLPLVLGTEKLSIKPCCPTPSSARDHKLCLIGQSYSHVYQPVSLFYSKQQHKEANVAIPSDIEPNQMAHLLQNSLSRTLASYYPFAGRLKDNTTIDCNDMGVEFFTVQIKCTMSEFLKYNHTEAEFIVYPKDVPYNNSYNGSLVVVQLNQFDCGGIAISVCMSHKLGDGSSLVNFVNDWSKTTRDPNFVPSPRFMGESIFPSSKILKGPLVAPLINSKLEECILRKFFFADSKIRALKAKVESESRVENPSRAELVSALIFKCATKVKSTTTSFRPCKLVHYADLRYLLNPRLPRSAIGNIISIISVTASSKEEMQLPRLVSKLRNEAELLVKKDHVRQNELVLIILDSIEKGETPFSNKEFDTYTCSNLSNCSLLSIDFGLGKPKKMSSAPGPFKNSLIFAYDKINGGILALVTSSAQEMLALECDEEFLEFASLIPCY